MEADYLRLRVEQEEPSTCSSLVNRTHIIFFAHLRIESLRYYAAIGIYTTERTVRPVFFRRIMVIEFRIEIQRVHKEANEKELTPSESQPKSPI